MQLWINFAFNFDTEELERRLSGSVGHGSADDLPIVLIFDITGRAVVCEDFSRTKWRDVSF